METSCGENPKEEHETPAGQQSNDKHTGTPEESAMDVESTGFSGSLAAFTDASNIQTKGTTESGDMHPPAEIMVLETHNDSAELARDEVDNSTETLTGSKEVLQEEHVSLGSAEVDVVQYAEAELQDDDITEIPCDAATYSYPLATELKQVTGSWKEFHQNNNFLRGCKWAPDGTCLLTCSDDNKMRLYNLPTELYSGVVEGLPEMFPALTVPQGEAVYDFCWYPKMNSWEPETCCFVTSCKDHPVHLWDAFYYHRRASYVPHNHLDEVVSPHSVAFSLDGEKLYCGLHKCVKVFDTPRPGRDCKSITIYEKKFGGQAGIISCIAMCPTTAGVYALGSYSCSVGLYSESTKGAVILIEGVGGGVTHMLFSQDGNLLYTGYRKNPFIKCWDLRNPGKVLYTMQREVNTNQRIHFDFYSNSCYLISGSTSGCIYAWHLQNTSTQDDANDRLQSVLQFQGHKNAVNGCSIHPTLPFLATSSGQRMFPLPCSDGDSSNSEHEEEDQPLPDNSVQLWSLLGKRTGTFRDICIHLEEIKSSNYEEF